MVTNTVLTLAHVLYGRMCSVLSLHVGNRRPISALVYPGNYHGFKVTKHIHKNHKDATTIHKTSKK